MDLTPMPLAVIISEENYTYLNHTNFTKKTVTSTVDHYLETYNSKIIIEFLYRGSIGINQTIKFMENLTNNNSKRLELHKYKLETYIPIVIIRDQKYENHKKFEHNTITRDNLVNTIEKFKKTDQQNKKNNDGFSIPGFKTHLFLLSLTLMLFVFLRKKYKRK